MFRRIVVVLVALVGVAPALADGPAARLTPEEAAAGWVVLFDGRDFSGLMIDGVAEVADGVLVIGGYGSATLRIRRDLGEDFELVLDCRVDGPGTLMFQGQSHGLSGNAMGAQGIFSSPLPEWRELRCRCRRRPQEDSYDIHLERLGPDGKSDYSTGMGLPALNPPAISFEVPAGTKLLVRGAKARPEPLAGRWWNTWWGYSAILASVLLVLLIAVTLVARRLRRREPSPAMPLDRADEEAP
jgi:hypothetical protein